MLAPEFLAGAPDALVELYAQVESDILADMARRINTYDYYIPAAAHQRQKLRAMGLTYDEINRRLAEVSGQTEREIIELMRQAGIDAVDAENAALRKAGISARKVTESEAMKAALKGGAAQTEQAFRNITRSTAASASRQLELALDRAWLQTTSGAFSHDEAIRMAVKDLAREGMHAVTYPSGKVDTIEVAVRRAVTTGTNQTYAQVQIAKADELGLDLVEVSAHAGARPEHAVWQGQIYSRSGQSTKYPDFVSSTGYGTGPGLCGWNCRHSFRPYIDGMPRAYTKETLRRYEEKTRTYNGQKLTEYEAAQAQRQIERSIRRWKREEIAMKAAGQDPSEAAAKIRKWQATQRDFLSQTGLKRQIAREQIADRTKTSAAASITGRPAIPVNPNATFKIAVPGYGQKVNDSISSACKETVFRGARDGNEHLILVNLKTGKFAYEEIGERRLVGGKAYYAFLDRNPKERFAFVHNHQDGGPFSENDMTSFLSEKSVEMFVAAGNNGVIYIAYGKKNVPDNYYGLMVSRHDVILAELQQQLRDGKIFIADYVGLAEIKRAEYLIKEYAKYLEVQT